MDFSNTICTGCGQPMRIARVRCDACGVHMEGDFELSPLARLSPEDQAFVLAFLRHHGSLKKMEELFEISYPTVKNRLGAINRRLDQGFAVPSPNAAILAQLARREISVDEALERLS